jgi:cyclopropane fatty-acyl-phospholipid synthase-like methyltransferase
MHYINLFPSDSRNSEDKRKIIESNNNRIGNMQNCKEFQTYGKSYWDGDKQTNIGYCGYTYDGRYKKTAERFIDFYGLKKGDRVLEVGCGKGYLLVEFYKLGMKVTGIELSDYACMHAHNDIKKYILNEDFLNAIIPEKSFDLIIAKDCLPHMAKSSIKGIITKIMGISKRNIFLEIEVCRNEFEKEMLYQWDITHITREKPAYWKGILKEAKYKGDYHFKVLIEDDKLGSIDDYMLKNKIRTSE